MLTACTAPSWTYDGTCMDGRRPKRGRITARPWTSSRPRTKPAPFADLFNRRQPVFCWLWANHREVTEQRRRLDGLTWEGIAKIMEKDGRVGSHGKPPNGHSVRRVWDRVCKEVERVHLIIEVFSILRCC